MILGFRLITVFHHPAVLSRSKDPLWGSNLTSLRPPHQGRREYRGVAQDMELRRKLMATDTDKGQIQTGGTAPGPDVMLGLWASWMDRMAAPAQAGTLLRGGDGRP